ncbi:MAG: hypothetical protein JJU29_09305 [Verrucomicrobia bacterium]|nr:hypothetical protein [Verrucomicrobiota bacterium]MCH8511732.1 hypothetical protein [Kiritimatiellia bacterium]
MKYFVKSKWGGVAPEIRISDEEDKLLYSLKSKRLITLRNSFVFRDAEDQVKLTSRQRTTLFLPQYNLYEGDDVVAKVGTFEPSKYYVDLNNMPRMEFHMTGLRKKEWTISDKDGVVAVIHPELKKWRWAIEIMPSRDSMHMLACMALLYNEIMQQG